MKNQGQFILSLRSKPPQSMKHRELLCARGWRLGTQVGLAAYSHRWTRTAAPASMASGLHQEQRD